MMKLACLLLGLVCCVCAAPSLLVQTDHGQVMGYSNNSTHWIWKGIPFAAPPVGKNRWKPPQPVTAWPGVLQATKMGGVCPGGGNASPEDCLYLNVWVPINHTGAPLPVLVWLYGGGFVEGNANGYPGEYLGSNDLIIVTLNYRLGALGFLYLPALMTETGTSGFFGIQDQRAAFQWVQNNIAAFGGDPKRVTIAGESAGAISVCVHLATPRSAGLFTRALMESGFCKIKSTEESIPFSNKIVSDLGCPAADPLACLLNKTVGQIMAVSKVDTYFPTVHPYELSEQPFQLIAKGTYNVVPLIAGINHDETSMWFCPRFADINNDQYVQRVNFCYGSTLAPALLQFYQSSKYPNPNFALIEMTSDSIFKCPTKQLAGFVSQSGKADSFVYSFDHAPGDKCHGAEHSNELSYVWWATNMSGQDKNLSQIIRGAWASFSANGVPSFPVQNLSWKKYDTTTEPFVSFDFPTTPKQAFLHDNCPFWDDLQTKFPQIDLHQTSVNCLYS